MRNSTASKPACAPKIEPASFANEAGLRYVSDSRPGITRRRFGKSFRYYLPDGAVLRDLTEIRRIQALAIPPAYSDVWICPNANGHIQATGRDARGRKQYRYHPRWREVRDEDKYGRMITFACALPAIRARVADDLSKPGLPREKVVAAVVCLLEKTLIRVGNDEYAKDNNSYGLTTLRSKHIIIEADTIHFHFRGKSGKVHRIDLNDRRLANIVRRCRDLPGYDLFEYEDDHGDIRKIESSDINNYLRETSGLDFTAKDFRTWAGTVLAASALRERTPFDSESEAKARRKRGESEAKARRKRGESEAKARRKDTLKKQSTRYRRA